MSFFSALSKFIFAFFNFFINVNIQVQMSKLFLVITMIVLGQTTIVPNRPDAIRCGADNSCCDNAIYFIHGASQSATSYFCQIYAGESRCVVFNKDGTYRTGSGHYDSRKGCQNKTLSVLERQGRTFNLADSAVNAKVTKLQQEIQALKSMKESWKKECKSELLADIKNNGLQIGSRWKIQQETTWFIIRDMEGTKTKDSRIAFPPLSLLDPR